MPSLLHDEQCSDNVPIQKAQAIKECLYSYITMLQFDLGIVKVGK